jgi:hypothetical protein
MPSNKKKLKKMKSKQKKSQVAATKRSNKVPKRKPAVKAKARNQSVNKKRAKKKTQLKTKTSRRTAPASDVQREQPLRRQPGTSSGGQSGDLQGLSRAQEADSESVEELVEEGNPFEADAIKGVEHADNADEREVHTHEVSEDDVPDEYLENE